jgi:nucleotide-binding universal stress UspA family protein
VATTEEVADSMRMERPEPGAILDFPDSRRKRMFKKIVVGLDGSEHAERALPYATELAKRDGAGILLVHVEEDTIGKGGGPLRADEDEIRSKVDGHASALSEQGIETEVRTDNVMLGGPAPSIAKFADEAGADLIVVGSRGLSGIGSIMLGSVSQKLLHIAKQPVLVVTPDAELSE